MADNITDNQAKDWLVSKYPYHLEVDTAEGEPRVDHAGGGSRSASRPR